MTTSKEEIARQTAALQAELANKPRDEALICSECGADFTCRTGEPGDCWCNNSPNLRPQFKLDGTCVCPNCLAMGKLEEVTKARNEKRAKRQAQRLR